MTEEGLAGEGVDLILSLISVNVSTGDGLSTTILASCGKFSSIASDTPVFIGKSPSFLVELRMTTPEPFHPKGKDQEPSPDESALPEELVPLRAIPSEQLFHGAKVVLITHAGEPYRLLQTKNGKLILQK